MEVEIITVSRKPVKTLVDAGCTVRGQKLYFESTGDAACDRATLQCLDRVVESQCWGGQ